MISVTRRCALIPFAHVVAERRHSADIASSAPVSSSSFVRRPRDAIDASVRDHRVQGTETRLACFAADRVRSSIVAVANFAEQITSVSCAMPRAKASSEVRKSVCCIHARLVTVSCGAEDRLGLRVLRHGISPATHLPHRGSRCSVVVLPLPVPPLQNDTRSCDDFGNGGDNRGIEGRNFCCSSLRIMMTGLLF